MNWKSRAKKVTPSSTGSKWKERAKLEKEMGQDRVASQEKHASAGESFREGVIDAPLPFINATMLGFGDEAWGAGVTAYKKATGDKRDSKEIYKEYRDDFRGAETKARKRSPIATFIADIVAPNPLSKLKKVGGTTTGIIQGLGYSDADNLDDLSEDVLISGTFGAGAELVAKGAKYIGGNPRSTEAKYLEMGNSPQAGAKNNALGIIDDTSDAMDRHRERGLFSKGADTYNLETHKYEHAKGGKNYSNKWGARASSKKEVLVKINKANTRGRQEVKKILKEHSPKHQIQDGDYQEKLIKTGEKKYKKGGYGETEDVYKKEYPVKDDGVYGFDDIKSYDESRLIDMDNELDHKFGLEEGTTRKVSKKSLNRAYSDKKGQALTLEDMQDEKLRIYDELQADYKRVAGGGPSKYNEHEVETMKGMARLYKDMIEDFSGNPNIKKLNQTMADNFLISEGLNKNVSKGFFGEKTGLAKDASKGGLWNRVESTAENIIDPSRPYRAKGMRMYEGLPEGTKQYIGGATRASGGRIVNDVNELDKPVEGLGGRPFGSPKPIVEELIKTPLPRTSDAVIEQKDFVLAKVAQQAPEFFDAIQDTINESPELVADMLPVIVQAAPHLFSPDRYNRVDGKILDPNMRAMATKDTIKNESLSNSERMLIISRLNKTGEFA